MKDATKRSILRWIHLVFGIPIIGYVYSPFAELPNYAPVVRFVSIPAPSTPSFEKIGLIGSTLHTTQQ